MRSALALLLALLASAPVAAQQVPDPLSKGNANVMGANGSIDLSASTVFPAFMQSPGSMNNAGSPWWADNWWGGRGGQNTQWLFGSQANPVTTAGTPVAIGIVQGKTAETCDGNTAATGCNSALLIQNMGTAASNMVSSGITSYTETLSRIGVGGGNAQAGNFIGIAGPGSKTGGMGLYAVGMRFSDESNAYGAEISVWNRTEVDCGPASYDKISRCTALYMAPRGLTSGDISSMIQVIVGNVGIKAREGLVFNNATISEKAINDQSEAAHSFNIGGTHTNGLHAEAGSITNNTFNDLSSSLRSINIAGTHSEAAIWVRGGAGFFGLNIGTPPTALFHMGGIISVAGFATGAVMRQALGGITDTASSGTVVTAALNLFQATSISATNPTTYTNATMMYLGDPGPGTNATFSNTYSLMTQGDIRVGGSINAAGGVRAPLALTGTASYALTSPASVGSFGFGTVTPSAIVTIGGSRSVPYSGGGMVFATIANTVTDTTSSGTVPVYSSSRFAPPTLAATNATTYVDAATLTIGGCPTAGTNVTITNCYGLKVGGDISVISGVYRADTTPGVSCTGAPTASFRSIGGIVTAC